MAGRLKEGKINKIIKFSIKLRNLMYTLSEHFECEQPKKMFCLINKTIFAFMRIKLAKPTNL